MSPERDDPLGETWSVRELPILRTALARLERGYEFVDLDELRIDLGFTATQIRQAVEALNSATPPYLSASFDNGWDGVHSPGSIDRIHERARRELGTWPSADNLVAEIASALQRAADETAEPEERTRLRTAADALTGFARDVAVAVAAKHLGA